MHLQQLGCILDEQNMSEKLLNRKLSLLPATAINMIDMVGIGPFITLPMVIGIMNGPWFLYAWIAGAILSFLDATIWSELGTTFPKAGGSYNFLKEAYGHNTVGKYMSFLFVWQTMFQAPLVIASAAIGFSAYFSYLYPLDPIYQKALSGGMVLLIILMLYRKIESIGKLSIGLGVIVIGTILWIIGSAILHGNFSEPLTHINDQIELNKGFAFALGMASVKSIYSYLGYYNVCHLGSEIIDPQKNIPRSMFISILCIAALYIGMNMAVVSVVPWQEAKDSPFVISLFMERLAGTAAAKVVTALILIIAFSSVFSATLGYSRIPYAAAQDGAFFKIFAKVHPQKNFPHISLLFLGCIAFFFSLLFKLSDVISAILAMRILIQFIGQGIGLLVLRSSGKLKNINRFKVPLYPLPVIIALASWIGILISTGFKMIITGIFAIILGSCVYFILAYKRKQWPFHQPKTEL